MIVRVLCVRVYRSSSMPPGPPTFAAQCLLSERSPKLFTVSGVQFFKSKKHPRFADEPACMPIPQLVLVEQDSRLLLGEKKRGFGKGYWNGFGGKVEAGETIEQAAVREVRG